MYKYLICLALFVTMTSATVNWVGNARFENFNNFYPNLMLETVYELEKFGWWNFRLNDVSLDIDQEIYDRHFQGQVNYTNGFLTSIQHLDFTDVRQSFLQSSTGVMTGSMIGKLNLHNPRNGFDVFADFGELGIHKFTGLIHHDKIIYDIRVQQNLNTSEISTFVRLESLSGNDIMEHLPDTDIGQVISRHFRASVLWDSVGNWADIVARAMSQLIEKDGLPKVCFNC